MSWIEPRTLNFVLLALYVLNSGWWAYHKNWPQALYWFAAFQITLAVTWGISR